MIDAERPLLVYTIGKTGSNSVVRSLEPVVDRPVWKFHRLDADSIDMRERNIEAQRPWHRPSYLWASQVFRRRLPSPERPWEVITLTRDPLAQSVSAFFQKAVRRGYARDDIGTQLGHYLSGYRAQGVINWFDDEMLRFLGIDVYSYPFQCGEPLVIETEAVRVLVTRLEDLDRVGPAALSEFAGVRVDHIVRANVGNQKAYADAYERFRANTALPTEVLETMYTSRYARHFYSDDEIARFRAAWKTSDERVPSARAG